MQAAFYQGNQTITIGTCRPIEPGPGEVQLKVSHVGICGTDLHIYHGMMDRRVTFPQIMGHEASGTVAALGEGVTGFAVGAPVTVMPLVPCRNCPACEAGHSHICHNLKFLGIDTPGAFQSYWTVPAYTLHHLPPTLSLEFGAMIEPLAVACHDVRIGQVQAGEYVVVLGGGPIGLLIALVSQHIGARVLVSEINPYRLNLARQLGLDAVDPRQTDLPAYVADQTAGAGADVVFEVTASPVGAEVMTQLPRTRGRIVVVGIFGQPPPVDLFRFFWRELRLFGARVYEHQDFTQAIQLAAAESIPFNQLITDIRPLDQLEASFKQMESGGEVMKILLKV
ncbi:MAG: Zn-dependent alcohol dehydrogenase [Chloroflexi bacterium]|nr:MAG: Zn-dependent alcohol dehydrogenase [Chloroflexota bacterium]